MSDPIPAGPFGAVVQSVVVPFDQLASDPVLSSPSDQAVWSAAKWLTAVS